MLSITQRLTCEAIVNLFETSSVRGDYSRVTVMLGDRGHLSYGRSQTTLAGGGLAKLIGLYCANSGARFGRHLQPYLPQLEARDLSLDDDLRLHNLLRAAADDLMMRDTQDQFFAGEYWQVALRRAPQNGIETALGVAVVYDSTIQGSWPDVRRLTVAAHGTPAALNEQAWVAAYVQTRLQWLLASADAPLRSSAYRMRAFQALIDAGRWALPLPLVVCDAEISLATLQARPPRCYDGPEPGERPLALRSPLLEGQDVRLLQLGLVDRGVRLKADGLYGPSTRDAVREFQRNQGSAAANGIADPALVMTLAEEYLA